MESSTIYSSIVSPRSRRLRTTGLFLLVAVIAMALYGYFGLMPAIERSIRRGPVAATINPTIGPAGAANSESPAEIRARHVRKLQIAVALAYWGVCTLLIVAVVVIAWLDFREVTRAYVTTRRAIWAESTGTSDELPLEEDD